MSDINNANTSSEALGEIAIFPGDKDIKLIFGAYATKFDISGQFTGTLEHYIRLANATGEDLEKVSEIAVAARIIAKYTTAAGGRTFTAISTTL